MACLIETSDSGSYANIVDLNNSCRHYVLNRKEVDNFEEQSALEKNPTSSAMALLMGKLRKEMVSCRTHLPDFNHFK